MSNTRARHVFHPGQTGSAILASPFKTPLILATFPLFVVRFTTTTYGVPGRSGSVILGPLRQYLVESFQICFLEICHPFKRRKKHPHPDVLITQMSIVYDYTETEVVIPRWMIYGFVKGKCRHHDPGFLSFLFHDHCEPGRRGLLWLGSGFYTDESPNDMSSSNIT